jgi:hypothetical protein
VLQGKISRYLSLSIENAIKEIIEAGTKIAGAKAPATTVGPSPIEVPPIKGKGIIVITTDPPRAKVYIGDVYYGLSPLSIDLDPGIYELRFRLKGFKEALEKVAIRPGHVMELEVEFER